MLANTLISADFLTLLAVAVALSEEIKMALPSLKNKR